MDAALGTVRTVPLGGDLARAGLLGPMNVLHVIPSVAARTGGPAFSVVEASLALQDAGAHVSIFSTDLAEAASAPTHSRAVAADLPAGAGALDIRLYPVRRPQRFAFSPQLGRALAASVAGYDVVHIHSLYLFPQYAAYRQSARKGIPYIVAPCGALDPYLRNRHRKLKAATDLVWQRSMLDHAAAIHYKTDDEAQLAADVLLSPVSYVAPNGIRMSEFQDLPASELFRTNELGGHIGPLVLFMGRLSHKKGLDVLIRAFAALRGNIDAAHLVIAGPDDERLIPSLTRLARSEGLESEITFVGMLNKRRRLEALAAADIFALPSHTENFGNAVLEAMASGVPTVISDAVNIAAEVEAARAGVVRRPTVEDFAEAMSLLLSNPAEADELARRGREFARRYEWASAVSAWLNMYAEVVATA
jgi:glycosyltransferase involved in cell wall biosynthesis